MNIQNCLNFKTYYGVHILDAFIRNSVVVTEFLICEYKERNIYYEKLNEMRIEKRLISSFRITTLITSVTAIAAILVLLIISNRYTYALQYFGFAQGDIGRR